MNTIVRALKKQFPDFDRETLELIVAQDEKGRYSFDETGAKIVLSSDWRLIKDDPEYGENYDYLVKRLQSVAGLVISDHTVDISWSSRGDEIRKYLEDHPEITGYVILDDIPFTSFDACNLGDHLILTSERRGLTQKDADEAIRKLNGDMQAT